ncbi:MAG: Ca-activated chloride channel family protein [Colwellia sp.]|jgi:Ca-activated chloride channel family protein
MDSTMVKLTLKNLFSSSSKTSQLPLFKKLKPIKKQFIIFFFIATCLFAVTKPQQFADLWLTRDQ